MKSALEQVTDVKPIQLDMQGWHSTEPLFKTLIDETQPKRIIEVGSWKGASAIHMASLTKDLGTCIYCVDTWMGGVDHMIANEQGFMPENNHIQRNDGYPNIYHQFMFNVKQSGFGDRIFPIPQTSTNAARYLSTKCLLAELIYIDGSHELEDVLMDIIMYSRLLTKGGVIFGDDYSFPGVAEAVKQYAKMKKVSAYTENDFWIIK